MPITNNLRIIPVIKSNWKLLAGGIVGVGMMVVDAKISTYAKDLLP